MYNIKAELLRLRLNLVLGLGLKNRWNSVHWNPIVRCGVLLCQRV